MLQAVFHAWAQRLAAVTKDRRRAAIRLGSRLDPRNGELPGAAPADVLGDRVSRVMADTDEFFTPPATADYMSRPARGGGLLTLGVPYHDQRMPSELARADYIVGANIARTLQVCRQAVLDARRAIAWLAARGYARIGFLGTSLGSCLALLTTAHEPLIRAEALNHISPHFADVVWRGLSTLHVRAGLAGHIDLDRLRALWRPISPRWHLERVRDRQTLATLG